MNHFMSWALVHQMLAEDLRSHDVEHAYERAEDEAMIGTLTATLHQYEEDLLNKTQGI